MDSNLLRPLKEPVQRGARGDHPDPSTLIKTNLQEARAGGTAGTADRLGAV